MHFKKKEQKYMGETKMNLRERALVFAKNAHEGQVRKYTGEPYFNHVESVGKRVAAITDNQEVIAAAILHDTLEDTDVTLNELIIGFGQEVAWLVVELTDQYTSKRYPELNRKARKKLEALRLADISTQAKLIKREDIEDNTSTIVEFDPGFAKIYLKEKALILELMDA